MHFELKKRGRFHVTVPKLPGCQFMAPNFARALDVAKQRIEAHLKSLAKAGKPIPIESRTAPALCHPIKVNFPRPTRKLTYQDPYPARIESK